MLNQEKSSDFLIDSYTFYYSLESILLIVCFRSTIC